MTTTPDINVRVARARDVASTRHARRSPLARLLLKTGVKLLLSFAAASSMSACIIPVGPEFQDPPGGPNAAPEILNPNFFTGTAVASTSTQDFSFTVSDPNGDPMWFRWVADFPPFDVNASRPIVVNTNSLPANSNGKPIEETIHCGDLFAGFSTHKIVAAVADHPFRLDVRNDLLVVDPPGKMTVISWTLTLTCQAPQ